MSETPVNDRYEENGAISLLAQDQYLREVAWMQALEPLTREEEEKLLGRILRARREPGNAYAQMLAKHARDRLAESYQPVVIAAARRAVRGVRNMELLDVVNEGNVGVLAAIDRYEGEPVQSYPFEVLVKVCIRHALWAVRYGSGSLLAVPRRIRCVLSGVRRLRAQWSQLHDEPMPVHELAAQLGVSEALIEEAFCVEGLEQVESLQRLHAQEDAEDRHGFVSLYAQAVASEQERESHLSELLEQALTPRQREVIRLRYGFDEEVRGECSRELVSQVLGVTSESVRQVESAAQRRLRARVELAEGAAHEEGMYQGTDEQYYSSTEAARVLEVAPSVVRSYARRGLLSVVRLGRRGPGGQGTFLFPKQAVHELAARRRGEGMSA